jgi:hypothetical protein
MSTIDYTKLNERIVSQAYRLSESQVKQLVQGKFERAQAELQSRTLKPLTK